MRLLRALADAVDAVVPGRAVDVAELRQTADDLARLPRRPRHTAAGVRQGLDVALAAFAAITTTTDDYHVALADLREATQQVDPTRPLAQQDNELRAVFRDALRVVYAAADAEQTGAVVAIAPAGPASCPLP